MSSRRSSIVAVWAIACWPAINFIAQNWNDVLRGGLQCLSGVIAITICLGLVGHLLHWYTERSKRDDLFVPWTVAICLLFSYLAVRELFILVLRRIDFGLLPFACWLVFAAVVMFVAWWFRASVRLQIAARTFSFVAAGAALVTLATAVLHKPASHSTAAMAVDLPITPVAARADVNIYYIILDGYGGRRSLREAMSFDNSPFLDRMAARGFRDMSSERSNYLQTAQTLGGIFSLQYPQTDDPRSWNDERRHYPGLLDAKAPPPLIARLKADGYSSWLSTTFIVGCPAIHVHCLSEQATIDAMYMAQSFIAPTPVGRALMHIAEGRRNALEPVSRQLPALLAGQGPLFVFIHQLAPHPPYSLDRNCERSKTGLEFAEEATVQEQRNGYVGALECVNSQVERLIDHIIALDAKSIIVVQGDHGADVEMKWSEPMDSWTEASIRERASYLSLIRAPERCADWMGRPLGQINTARFVLACAEGRTPEFLSEHTYISSYRPGPKGMEVRDWRR